MARFSRAFTFDLATLALLDDFTANEAEKFLIETTALDAHGMSEADYAAMYAMLPTPSKLLPLAPDNRTFGVHLSHCDADAQDRVRAEYNRRHADNKAAGRKYRSTTNVSRLVEALLLLGISTWKERQGNGEVAEGTAGRDAGKGPFKLSDLAPRQDAVV